MLIHVTTNDIQRGQCSKGPVIKNCAIARAIKREFQATKAEWWGGEGFVLLSSRKKFLIEAVALKRIHDWVDQHDQGKPLAPMSFRIRIKS